MEDCIFCKIIRGDIPSHKVYEDEHALAFLDAKPTVPGHTLVIPKKHIENIFDADDETLAQTMHAIRLVAPAVRDAMGAKGAHVNSNNGSAAGQIVFHLHFHIVPRHDRKEFEFWPHQEGVTDALAIAKKIRQAL
jgi:histidine triad (HIT) family protein